MKQILKKIANIFNEYFSAIAEKTKTKIKFANKSFDKIHHDANENFFFLKRTTSMKS